MLLVVPAILGLAMTNACTATPKNQSGWVKVADTPRVYIPAGHPEAAQRNLYHGKYVVSKKHRTKWYVPNKGVPGRTPDELEREAKSFCPPKGRDRYPFTIDDAGLIAGNTVKNTGYGVLAVAVCLAGGNPGIISEVWNQ